MLCPSVTIARCCEVNVSRDKRLLRNKADEYDVSYYVMDSIVNCETAGTYDPSIPSEHVYHAGNVPRGYSVGDKEDSHGLAQIHLPAHTHVSKEEATNALYAADFLARNLAVGRGSMWTCYNKLAMKN